MYLRLINVKAIERQRDSYILVINNRYERWVNHCIALTKML